MSLPNLLTDREFATYLKLSEVNGWRTVQEWLREGKLKGLSIRIGDKWRIREDKIEGWLQKGGMRG